MRKCRACVGGAEGRAGVGEAGCAASAQRTQTTGDADLTACARTSRLPARTSRLLARTSRLRARARAGRRVIGRVIIANAKRAHDRERRGTTAIHTAWSSSKVARLSRKTSTNSRVTRPHLTRAAVMGRVAARIMNNYMNLGDG